MTADRPSPNDREAQAAQLAQAGIRAAKSGRNVEARSLLRQSLQLNDANEQAWLWLAAAVESPGERRVCLENVLDLNPENAVARRALARVVDEVRTTNAPKPGANRSAAVSIKPRQSTHSNAPPISQRNIWAAVALIGLLLVGGSAFFIISNQRFLALATLTPTSFPTATLGFIAQQQTLDSQAISTSTSAALPFNPTITPLPTLFAVIPSWTPEPSATLPPTATPTATPLPLTGLRLVFVGEGRSQTASGLYTIKADGSGEQSLLQTSSPLIDPAWSPDGRQLAYVATIGGIPTLLVANADGSQPRQLLQSAGKYMSAPSWSPDSNRLTFAATNADTGHAALYIVHGDGTAVQALTDGQFDCHDPAWSPDGKLIMYAADVTNRGYFQLYGIDPSAKPAANDQDTPEPPQALTVSANSNYNPVWSPDGHQIAFVSTRDGHAALYLMAPDGTGQKPLGEPTTAESRDPSWSPDGRWIAFSSNRESGVFALFVIALDNGQVRRLTDLRNGSAQPRFYPIR